MIGFLASLPPAAKVLMAFGFVITQASTFSFGPANLLLNAVTVAVALFVAVKAGRSKLKDETINQYREANDAKDSRIKSLRDELDARVRDIRQIEQGAVLLKQELAAAEAANEVLQKYTAEHALTAVMATMDKTDTAHERRHREVMLALQNVQTALERT